MPVVGESVGGGRVGKAGAAQGSGLGLRFSPR